MPEKLTVRDYRFILICIALAAISLVITVKYFYTAFPEASIKFDVTRDQSRPVAEQFLLQRGYRVENHRHSVIFGYDYEARVFLEKEMGLAQANQLLGTKIKLWRWQHRWFRPLQKEEFRVDVTPQGEIVGFQHLIREEDPAARLTSQAAQAVAVECLTQMLKKDLGTLEFVGMKSEQRPNRTDHTFTWKDKDFAFQGSSYRFEVIVQGDRVGSYQEFLKVPEKWNRDYQKLRSLNETAGRIDLALTVLLGFALLVMLIRHLRRGDIRWKTAVIFGLTAAGLDCLSSLNSLSISEFYYDTTESYGSFLTSTLFFSIFSALFQGALICLITAGAEPLYRNRFKDKISLLNLFGWRSLRTKSYFLSLILGLTLTPCFLAYQTIFYLWANKLGAWAPADVPYDELLNTSIPWVYVLLSGFFPAVSEEFMFRMFSIPFIEKLVKSTGLALVLAGFIWGFGHAGYPNQPFYIRGVEVGLAGIVVGLIMLRFNILVVLIWHYTIDAAYAALLMLRSDNPYYILSGSLTAFIFFIPLLIALVSYIRAGGFESGAGLTNQSEITPMSELEEVPVVAEPVSEIPYPPLSAKRIWFAVGVVGLLLSLYALKVERIGEYVDFGATRSQATHIADEFLQAKHVDPRQYNPVLYAHSEFDRLAAKYVLAHSDIKTLNDMFGQQIKSALWAVRYFKPLQKEEYIIYVDPRDKSVYTFEHIIAEDAPGADLTESQALSIATAFLRSQGLDPDEYELVESSSQKRPARRDYRLIWQARPGDPRNVGEATFRLRLDLQGDEVSRFQRFVKLPEGWVRERQKATTLLTIRFWSQALLLGVLGFFAITIFITSARHGLIPWRPTLWLALGITGIVFLDVLNNLPLLYQDYETSIAPTVHLVTKTAESVRALVGVFIAAIFGLGLGTALYPQMLQLLRPPHRGRLARDASISALLVIGAMFGFDQVRSLLVNRFPAATTIPSSLIPRDLDTALPALSHLASAVFGTLVVVIMVGLIVHVTQRYLKNPIGMILALLMVMPLLVPNQARTGGEFLFNLATVGLSIGGALALVRGVLRNNLLAYPASVFLVMCFQSGYDLTSQSTAFFIINGQILFAIVAAVIVWLIHSRSGQQTDGGRERTRGLEDSLKVHE
ncbi:MAG: CPBP family intramembrane metalloprotease [Acidobacteria bacterium]|nr:CPBP family intramembrane metalloprotease [Acidobacteriota bacterium]